jgi:hypothetical protein
VPVTKAQVRGRQLEEELEMREHTCLPGQVDIAKANGWGRGLGQKRIVA